MRAAGFAIDPSSRKVSKDGQEFRLTPIEFDLLYQLAARAGIVHTRERLLSEVWGYRDDSGARTIDSHIGALRRKLGPDVIRTIHGVGYALQETPE